MTRVLITGANGFVGRQITRALDTEGVEIVAVVRDGKLRELSNYKNICNVVTSKDIFSEDDAWWEKQCKGVDIVFHAAWFTEPGKYQNSSTNIECLMGSLLLAKGAIKAGVGRFIGIGTCAEYDERPGILSVDTPLRPSTVYAAAKASLFFTLSQWLPNQGISFAWTRLFYLYGEGDKKSRLMAYIRTQITKGECVELSSGKQIRDFLDVADAGKKIAEIGLGSQTGAINICSGVPVSVRQLAEQIGDEFGRRDLLKFGVREDNAFDPPYVIGVPNA